MRTLKQLVENEGKVWVYLDCDTIKRAFLEQAKNEGFHYEEQAIETNPFYYYVVEIRQDKTLSWIDTATWYWSFHRSTANTPMKIDYEKVKNGERDIVCYTPHFVPLPPFGKSWKKVMSFEDQLRQEMQKSDAVDRNKLLRDASNNCVKEFKAGCLNSAQMGRSAYSTSACYHDFGKTCFVCAVSDDEYEAIKKKLPLLAQYPSVILIRLSEAEAFIALVKQAFLLYDMPNAKITLQENFLDRFGVDGRVRFAYRQYDFLLSMSW